MRRAWHMEMPRRLLAAVTIGLAALLSAAPAGAQSETPADTFQPWHAVMYRSVLAAELSPDGSQIAFLRSKPRRPLEDDSGRAWVELYLLDANGQEVPFVTGEVSVGSPVWISDDELVFATRRDGDDNRSLYRISTRGGEARKLLEHEPVSAPST